MAKLTLNDVSNLLDTTTAQTTLSNNNTAVEDAIENTLSRDGTGPNSMDADLDMNSNRIINLPSPIGANEPLRLTDLSTFVGGGTVTNIPAGGAQDDILAKSSGLDYDIEWADASSLFTSGTNINIVGNTINTTTNPTFTTSVATPLLNVTGTTSGITSLQANPIASGTVTLPAATDTLVGKATTDALTNKTYNKVAITAPATSATLTIPDGVTLTGPAASGTAMTLGNTETVTGVKTFGSAGAVGRLKISGTTSGSTTLDATAVASGTVLLPAASDTLVGKATTDTLTNKTISGASNTLSNIALSSHATQAAFTLVGNNTSGAAAPTAVDIATLTSKGTPGAGDFVMISDQAASGAWKRATVASVGASSGVSSIDATTGAFTTSNGITSTGSSIQLTAARRTNPTTQTFTSGTAATYTTPANVQWIEVTVVGGGGSGGGGGTGGTSGTAGNASNWGTTLLVAGGGSAGVASAGGAALGGNNTTTISPHINLSGGGGSSGHQLTQGAGGAGGNSFYGGGGGGGAPGAPGNAAAANSGGGGGGGSNNGGTASGGGGGSGGVLQAIINSPSATYTYTVGAATTGGAAGTSGAAGGNGAAGHIVVKEFYNS